MAGDLGRRLAVAGAGIPVGVLLIYLGGWALGGVIAVVAALGTREFYALAANRGSVMGGGSADATAPPPGTSPGTPPGTSPGAPSVARPFQALGIGAAILFVLMVAHDPVWARLAAAGWTIMIVLLIVSLFASVFWRGPTGAPLGSTAATVTGVLYTAGTLVFALLIRNLPEAGATSGLAVQPWHGTVLLVFPMTATWVGDSAAYFAGSRWGRHKLLPSASPKKSVEGAVAGLLGSVLVGVLFGILVLGGLPVFAVSPLAGGVIGLLLGIAAQVGDLAESVLKRDAGVKDSGSLLPGHGGVLDRFDGILVTLPLAYLLIVLNRWLGF